MTSIAPLNAVPSPSGGASPQWDGVTSEYERRVEPFTLKFGEDMLRDMLGSTAAGTGKGEGGNDPRTHKILDLGCGTGGLSLLAASLPGCLVTAVDVSPSMADRTRLRSSALGLAVDCAVSDGQSLPPGWSGSFDCALANFSVIFFPEPTGGVREVLRCLQPGGVIALSAWGDHSETAAFQVFPDAAADVIPDAGGKIRPLRITGSRDALTKLLGDAGFVDVRVIGPVTHSLAVTSPEEYYLRFALTSPPIIEMIDGMAEETREIFKTKVMELATERGGLTDGGISLDMSAYLAFGTKPS